MDIDFDGDDFFDSLGPSAPAQDMTFKPANSTGGVKETKTDANPFASSISAPVSSSKTMGEEIKD